MYTKTLLILLWMPLMLLNCSNTKTALQPVSVADFADFIEATGYVTEAEQYGWSIVQIDVNNFKTMEGSTWLKPDGIHPSKKEDPVTQVSYNDVMAYCKWAKVRLPSYKEYWELVEHDTRKVHDQALSILPLKGVNIVGNAWDITNTHNAKGEIRLAGGSYLCNPYTCNGTLPERKLYVDKTTGNIHIGFSVIPL